MPALEKLVKMGQDRQNKPPQLPPDAQVVKDTSMAETQRKTAADQAKQAFDQAKLQKDMQEHTEDNQTKIAIENAKLTHQTIQNIASAQAQAPALPQVAPAPPMAPEMMPPPQPPQGV
jgi:exopolyphosphatase/pppGpp-phosphohydrolase